jgi:3-polyprenyl-4-hydroxybenzoate decarboxylase
MSRTAIHLSEHLADALQANTRIFPTIPAFCQHAESIDDLVTQFYCRVLVHLGLEQAGQFRWKGRRRSHRSQATVTRVTVIPGLERSN